MKYQQIDVRQKILIPIVLISLAGTILALLFALLMLEKQSEQHLAKEQAHARYAIRDEFMEHEDRLISEAIALSSDPATKISVESNNVDRLIEELAPAKATFGIDSIRVIDNHDVSLATLGPDLPSQNTIINSRPTPSKLAMFARSNDEIWLLAVAPIRSEQGSSIGFIILGKQINSDFLKDIKEISGAQVVVEYAGLFAGSSNAAIDTAIKSNSKESDADSSNALVLSESINNEPYLIDRIELNTDNGVKGTVYTLSSTRSLYQAKKSNIMAIIVISVFSLMLLILVIFIVTHNIVKPLDIMSKRARMIADGNYKQRIEYTGVREIDELATSFNVMSESLEATRQTLEERAYTDSLTGLFNHRYFQDNLANELQRTERYGHPLSLIVIDIDNFKKVNDSFGHKKGDVALKLLAERMRISTRETDIPCRIGGEEFAIILPETPSSEAFIVAERLRLDIGSQPIEEIGRITISLGVATIPEHAAGKDSLIEKADNAMYQAKRRGKNLTIIYDGQPSLTPFSKEKHSNDEAYYADILNALAMKVEIKDRFEVGHSEHVAAFASMIGQELGLPAVQVEHLRIAGRLHDIGKVAVPDIILRKKERLTSAEHKQLQAHPVIGARILTRTKIEPVLEAVLYHHERLDGSGYPYGLKGDEIPLYAKIMAVADSFEVMISDRPWRAAMPVADALNELRSKSGTRLDENIVNALINVVERSSYVRDIIENRNKGSEAKLA